MKQTYGLESILAGADAMGRGGAYLTNADSNHFVFQNYSLLQEDITPRVSLTVFKLLNEVNYLSAAYSQGNFSLGFLDIQESGGYVRDLKNNLIGGKIGYRDTTLFGAYAFRYSDFQLGVRGKYYSKVFSEIEGSAYGLALDLAGAYRYDQYWSFGAELNNLFGTSLLWNDGFTEKFPQSFGLGLKFRAFGPEGYWHDWFDQQLDFYSDLRLEENGSFMNAGLEYWLSRHIALRAGLNQTYTVDEDNNDSKYTRFVAGVGFNWLGLYFDYAYNPGDDIAANVTHFFTLAYRFSLPPEAVPTPEPVIEILSLPPPRQRMFSDIDHLTLEEQIAIEDSGYLGFMIGYGDSLFKPDQALTRRELMLVVNRLLEKEGRPPYESAKYFPDIAETSLADIDKAVAYGMLRGYPDGLARVEMPVRRDEAGSVFARYAGISGSPLRSTPNTYADVPPGHWAYKDLNLTRQHYLTQGIGQELYNPREYMLRRDAARVLSRLPLVRNLRVGLPEIAGLTYSGQPPSSSYTLPPAAPASPPLPDHYTPPPEELFVTPAPQTVPQLKTEAELLEEIYRELSEDAPGQKSSLAPPSAAVPEAAGQEQLQEQEAAALEQALDDAVARDKQRPLDEIDIDENWHWDF
jgi:hypothetical protein